MIKIQKFVFNPFQENSFILFDETGESVLIDMGCYTVDEKHEVLSFIDNNRLKPKYMLNTHCHVDHILGTSFLYNKLSVITCAHKDDLFLLDSAVEHGKVFGLDVEEPPEISLLLEDGDKVVFGNSVLEVVHLPGHSPGSIGFYSEANKFLISGDVLFNGSIGRTDLPGGSFETLINSITSKILTLPPETVVYPGHGQETTVESENFNNPFLNS